MANRNYRQAFGLKILNAQHPGIRRLKREGHQAEIHGNKFWNSSYLIMNYLTANPLPKRTRVLEIGCGWGLLGLFCAMFPGGFYDRCVTFITLCLVAVPEFFIATAIVLVLSVKLRWLPSVIVTGQFESITQMVYALAMPTCAST